MKKTLAVSVLFVLAASQPAPAAIILFDLQGAGGMGLLGSNEVPIVIGGGSGGETGAGISFDNVSNVMTINVGWGSINGFVNLTGNASVGHIHGPTLSPAPTSFTQSAGVKYTLDSLGGWNPSLSSGGITGVGNTVNILAGDVAGMLAGQFYINIHTAVNGGGEIRGYLIPVPEPTSMALCGVGIAAAAMMRRRNTKA